MGHLVCIAEVLDSRSRIAAADDRRSIGFSKSCCNSLRSVCKNRVLEYTHRAVPDNGLGILYFCTVKSNGLRSDIHAHLVSRNLVDVDNFGLDGRIINRIREVISDNGINRKKKLLAELLCFLDHFLAVVKLGVIHKRSADFVALCLDEGICHAAADDEGIALFKKIGDDVQLVSNLGTAEDCDERTNRILNCIAEELDLLLHKISDCAGTALCADILGYDGNRSMCSVSGAECIADIIVSEISELLCKALSCLFRLGLFLASEAGILKKYNVAVLHISNCLCSSFAGYVVIRNKLHFLAELFGQTLCNRCKGLAFVGAVLYLAEMGAKDNLCAFTDQLLDGGKCCDDTGIIRDFAVLHRNIEVASYKDFPALCVKIIDALLV